MAIDIPALKENLRQEWDYSPVQIEKTIAEITSMAADIQQAFESFLASRTYPTAPEYAGFTPARIHEKYPFFQPPAVFLLLDWLRAEPAEALAALEHEYGHRAA